MTPTKDCPQCNLPWFPEEKDMPIKFCTTCNSQCMILDNQLIDLTIEFKFNNRIITTWDFEEKELTFGTLNSPSNSIPWFEPNLNDFNKLKEKMKLYFLLS